MSLIKTGGNLHQTMRAWRRDLHAHPETAFQEYRTSSKVAELLESFGLNVTKGIAGTGVVATLDGELKGNGHSIGLRADMDALNIQELNTFSYNSKYKGKMHACGHDGHTAMLLGAAKYLSENKEFAGRVVFIFQPAEEGESGAKVMCDQGLFEQFPVDAVYGMHNWPGLKVGSFAVHSGPIMASMDVFDITITGQGCHAGMPHVGVDPVLVSGQLIVALQHIVSRTLNPMESVVLSITKMHSGDTYNVIPESAKLSGTCRAFSTKAQDLIESKIRQQVTSLCHSFGAKGALEYKRIYPPTINHQHHSDICSGIAKKLVGKANVLQNLPPSTAAEDFAFMLQKRPGAYIWIGNGAGQNIPELHNPYYDFNDDILALGANYWVTLVQSYS